MIRHTMTAACLTLALWFVAGCGSGAPTTHEAAVQQMIGNLKELNAILKGVTDEASAKAAVPKLQALNGKMAKLKEAMDKMGAPKGDAEKELEKKYGAQMEEVMKEMMTQMFRIGMDQKLSKVLDSEMEKLGQTMPN